MSSINVTNIKSRQGGAPTFPQGLNVSAGVATFAGNVSIAGTLTYDDVTNIDSVGIITAGKGFRSTTGGLIVSAGVATFAAAVDVNSSADVSGGVNLSAGNLKVTAGIASVGAGLTLSSDFIHLTDNSKIQLGIASDLALYHNGSHSVIQNATGSLLVEADSCVLRSQAQENYLVGTANGSVDLYYDNTKRFETTTAGSQVTGILTATSFDGDSGVVKFTTNGTERPRIAAAGNVGVNTTDPQELLSVSQGNLFVSNSTAPQIRISKDNTDASDNDRTLFGQATGGSNFVTGSAAGDTVLRGNTTGALLFGIGTAEKARLTATGGISLNNGELIERCYINATAWSTNGDIDLDNGMVQYNTSNLAGTNNTLNITSSVGINTQMATGDVISVTCISTQNANTAYVNNITVDHAAVTENWIGGSAPTDGGSSGVDIYAFSIIKTASATYTVIANQNKTS